jgi:hypothetical protein
MSKPADLAQAVLALFPNQATKSGHEVQTHRVETFTDEKRPNELDVVIVQVFPTPAKRNELTIEVDGDQLVAHPKDATDTAMAQLVAFRLQSAALGSNGPPITSVRNEQTGLWGHSFRVTPLPEEPALEAGTVEAPAADVPTLVEPKSRRNRELRASEANV